MKASELYQYIKAHLPGITEKNICALQNCTKCNMLQNTLLIDFDAVTKEYCRGRSTLSSTDGVKNSPNKDNVFYFVEIKSIKDVIINPETNTLTNENNANKQSTKFITKIGKKLPNSIEVCNGLVRDNDLFNANLLPSLVFVSDIDTNQRPLDSFAMNLKKLSDPPAYYEIVFNQNIKTGLNTIKQKHRVNVYYTYCRLFDKEFNTDFQNSLI